VREAAQYGLYDLDRLERMILRRVARDYFLLVLNAELFANNGRSCRIHCEQSSDICESLPAPGDWIKASEPLILLSADGVCVFVQASLMFPERGG
jgi:hypothetical protein